MTMKSAFLAIAFLSGTAALAQTGTAPPPADTPAPMQTTPPTTTPDPLTPDMTPAPTMPPPAMATAATGQTAMPGNAAPEHDARGIAVISDAATVPAGYNGTPDTLTGTGGPLLDAATGEPAATPDAAYPRCSRTVTDNCVQAYERGRHR
jgi:hypothetical protein